MKKTIIILIITIFSSLYTINNFNKISTKKEKEPINDEIKYHPNIVSNVNNFYIYGRYLNLGGNLNNNNFNKLELVIDGDVNFVFDLQLEINANETNWTTSQKINLGILLDTFPVGNYKIYLQDDNDIIYNLVNQTLYKETEYYSIQKDNITKKVLVKADNNFNINIENQKNDGIYDIIIDAGHGGKDFGTLTGNIYEKDINLSYALKLKEKLSSMGLTVALTRNTNEFNDDKSMLETYDKDGRIDRIFKSKAKLVLSIHCNNINNYTSFTGFEIYTPGNIDYTFVKDIVSNVMDNTSSNFPNKKDYNEVFKSIYTRNINNNDIKNIEKDANENNYIPYDIKANTPYYYILRETGGIITGSFVDGRDKNEGVNLHLNSNIGIESYLIELGYLNNSHDLDVILNEQTEFIEAIAKATYAYLKN